MDERLMKKCIGQPVPEWDMAHRLPINRPVGPEVQDFGATFCINSTFMDVTEPSYLDKQWVLAGAALACAGMAIGPYGYVISHAEPGPAFWMFAFDCLALLVVAAFGSLVWKIARGLVFGLKYRPIRFHRSEARLYAIRTRRYFVKPGDGDVVWEAPWTSDSIFCLHREETPFGTVFHIRHYTVDAKGNVVRAFSIGREWTGKAQVEMALAQWNYWCRYMSDGPSRLPKPMLFHTQRETLRESFLFSMYGFGMRAPAFLRIIMMPQILLFTGLRALANVTNRAPVWPADVEKISSIAQNDPYAEPRHKTPVGWGDTVLAQQRGDYPENPKARAEDWTGEADGKVHAVVWLANPAALVARSAVRGAQ
ncbi:hypothetical protein SAMN05443245_0305 [Paraburkholderia fungorum]|uniref:DUF6708 domain-containing protein n=1 Tax=Paraburkholderia fungorum TaxID=134537 RepID=A0A1H0YVN3_9BURK|nr:DUF6708 domain-containing protein [Paraburkholderia fungorum]SDQ19194.1 hypothetical protein SAMN05443245_0305 [Paraburkholderia fungorum]